MNRIFSVRQAIAAEVIGPPKNAVKDTVSSQVVNMVAATVGMSVDDTVRSEIDLTVSLAIFAPLDS